MALSQWPPGNFLRKLRSDLPHWNWYGFPSVYLMAQIVVQVVAFAVGGVVLAKLIKTTSPVLARTAISTV